MCGVGKSAHAVRTAVLYTRRFSATIRVHHVGDLIYEIRLQWYTVLVHRSYRTSKRVCGRRQEPGCRCGFAPRGGWQWGGRAVRRSWPWPPNAIEWAQTAAQSNVTLHSMVSAVLALASGLAINAADAMLYVQERPERERQRRLLHHLHAANLYLGESYQTE